MTLSISHSTSLLCHRVSKLLYRNKHVFQLGGSFKEERQRNATQRVSKLVPGDLQDHITSLGLVIRGDPLTLAQISAGNVDYPSLTKQPFVATHTIRQTDTPALLDI